MWSELEVPIVVFSICLPGCFWFFKRLREHGFVSAFTSSDFSDKPQLYRTPLVARGRSNPARLASEDEGFEYDAESVRLEEAPKSAV